MKRAASVAPPEPYRIVGLDWVFLPNASAQYGLEDIRGSDPMEFFSTSVVNPTEAIITTHAVGPDEFRLRVASAAPVVVASSHPFQRGWQVRVNGANTKVMRVNGAFLGFQVPAGSSDVVIRYIPLSYWVPVGLATLVLFGLAAILKSWNRMGTGVVVLGPRNEK